ncbi:pseudouridine synthase [Reichenbachiella sp. MALMAid0571]|uniref:pseudouridine synthase n=1 Tax=Reichenbachiella sp. MALMAid0571 TaxID=3143939 RepID=UPI0032E020A3
MKPIEILFQDEYLVAVNKPHGLLVHRSRIARDATEFALQQVRNMIGQTVYPAHRLDRKTGGVLLFALDQQTHKDVQELFASRKVLKKYWTILRGHTDDNGIIDYPLTNDSGKVQEAVTNYKTLHRTELQVPFGKHSTSRYSLVEVIPETGRMHQIRKHFGHIFHPIIADRKHGCNKQNKLFKEKWGMDTMLLHASELSFTHPITNQYIVITAQLQDEFKRMMQLMGFEINQNDLNQNKEAVK